MAKLTSPPFKEYDNFWTTGNVSSTYWTVTKAGDQSSNTSYTYNVGTINAVSSANGTSRESSGTCTTVFDLRSLGTNFSFSVSASATQNSYANGAGSYIKLNNTTLLSCTTGGDGAAVSGGGVTFWVSISGTTMNIRRSYVSNASGIDGSGSGGFTLIADNTNVDISAATSLVLQIVTGASTDSNSYATSSTALRLSPIIFTKELIGSNRTL